MTQADDIMTQKIQAGGSDASYQLRIPQLVAQLYGINLPDDDKAIILKALKRFRNRAVSHKYGGMGDDYILAGAALEAWERFTG